MTEDERKIQIRIRFEGIYNLSPKTVEPYFSKRPCRCCGSPYGGDRYDFIGTLGKKHTDKIIELSCCIDCFEYLFT